MNPLEIITKLKENKVVPRIEGNSLKLSGETRNLSDELLSLIKTNKDILLSFLKKNQEATKFKKIKVVEKQDFYPVSNAQRRIWMLSQFEGGSDAYNILTKLYIKGKLEIENLNYAFRLSIKKHEILRTVFKEKDGEISQIILEDTSFNISDPIDIERENIELELEKYNKWSFDLERGPLIKVDILQISFNEYILVLNLHHIITDGWSIGVMIKEVMESYELLCKNIKIPDHINKIQYKDYSAWLSDRINDESGLEAKQFWRDQLNGDIEPLNLPYDYIRPDVKSFAGLMSKFYLDFKIQDKIQTFCLNWKITPFNFYRAIINILLSKISGQKEIIIGTPVSGRNHFDLENQLGLYVNTLPLKSIINYNDNFCDFVKDVSENSFKLFEFQDYPFDKIVEDLGVSRDTSRNPLFDVLLVFQNTAISDGTIDITNQYGFNLYPLDQYLYSEHDKKEELRSAKFDLNFNFDREPNGRHYLEIEFATSIFKKSTIDKLFSSFIHIINQACDKPDIKIKEIDIISNSEKHLLLEKFNNPINTCCSKNIIDLFEEPFNLFAEKTAIIFGNQEITYSKVFSYLNSISSHLKKCKDFKNGIRVGLMFERNEVLIPAILAIIKSGCIYVPIDVKYPSSRIEYIVHDSEPSIILTDSTNFDRIPNSFHGNIIKIEDVVLEEIFDAGISDSIKIDDIAYIIYTSGSTGNPKGVQISHKNTVSFLKWSLKEFKESDFDIIYAVSSYCFDLSIFEFLFPLLAGKTIRILKSPEEIEFNLLNDRKVMLNTVPSVIRHLIESHANFENVSVINMAGEPLPISLINQLESTNAEIRNLYGPTEDTTYSTCYRIINGFNESIIPIGKAIEGTQIYILDEYQKLAPLGIIGEIYLSGHGLSSGYLKNDELTKNVFVDNPFLPGLKMYRTGDYGRWLPDGNIEYSGRHDEQVKVRGHRIELREIEQNLRRCKGVEDVAVTIFEKNNDKYIVAYCLGEENKEIEIRNQYYDLLPSFMRPDYLVWLPSFPLNSNGKLDKKSLPQPQKMVSVLISPETTMEETLLSFWKEILETNQIGVTNNFFEIGGHSLKALKLRALILNKLSIDISLSEIFKFPTIRQQAQYLSATELKPIQVIKSAIPKEFYPLSLLQEKLWSLNQFSDASVAYNMPAAFRIKGAFDKCNWEKAINIVIQRHEILRTTFEIRSGLPVQIVLNSNISKFYINEIVLDHEPTKEEEKELLYGLWEKRFDLSRWPLFDCTVIFTSDEAILSFNMHHLISDGWSINVFIQEVVSVYNAILKNETVGLPELEFHYKDFSIWQKELQADKTADDIKYWKQLFSVEPPILNIHTDFPRPKFKTFNGSSITINLKEREIKNILTVANQQDSTIFMALVAVLNILLKKYTDQSDIIIGTPVSGRINHTFFNQIGLFANVLPLRTIINPDLTFIEFLKLQRDIILEALSHDIFPMEDIIEEVNISRDFSRSPLFDVMVVLQNFGGYFSEESIEFGNHFSLEKIPLNGKTSKYDLTFIFEEVSGKTQLTIEYNCDLFKVETIRSLGEHFNRVLNSVSSLPEQKIQNISLVEDEEFDLLSRTLDKSKIGYNESSTIISLFQKACMENPDAIAIEFEENSMTYRELNYKSDQIAQYLIEEVKLNSEQLVGLILERSPLIPIAIIGILKAGGAYLPIDPNYPNQRIDFIIDDSNCSVILSDGTEMDSFNFNKGGKGIKFIDITKIENEGLISYPKITPNNLAYVIYTSGTTGKPKGVLIEHKNVTRLFFNEEKLFDFSASDKWTLFHSYCFDFSVWEIFGAILFGSTLVIVPKETAQDSSKFFQLLKKSNVTVLNQTPTAFRSLVKNNSHLFEDIGLSLRYIVFGGEKFVPDIVKSWKQAYPETKIINMYGITETTVHVTFKEITNKEIQENVSNVGIPIPTLKCYVLDKDLNPIPYDLVGELYVGGAGVARGYLNRPELTNSRFILDPITKDGSIIYRSGDYAKILRSGEIEYIGRKDEQIKIRGHRIEIPEIEISLKSLSYINDAIVLATQDSQSDYELVAYIILDKNVNISINEIRLEISKLLPSYMVPTYFIFINEFPTNSNGKLDITKLPKINEQQLTSENCALCRNEIDEKIKSIWEEILERSDFGISDNFFNLGGHSLKATRVLSKINEEFEIKIDLKSLFIDPTIMHLSNYIETMKWMEQNPEEIILSENDDEIIF